MDIKSSTLVSESNRLYEALNTYNNVYVPKVNGILSAFGITEPLLQAQIQALTTRQKGQLFEQVSVFLTLIGKEVGSRKFEVTIIGAGYLSVKEAIVDIPNRFIEATATAIQTNLTKTVELLSLLDGTMTSAITETDMLYVLLGKVLEIKNKVAEVTPFMARV